MLSAAQNAPSFHATKPSDKEVKVLVDGVTHFLQTNQVYRKKGNYFKLEESPAAGIGVEVARVLIGKNHMSHLQGGCTYICAKKSFILSEDLWYVQEVQEEEMEKEMEKELDALAARVWGEDFEKDADKDGTADAAVDEALKKTRGKFANLWCGAGVKK